MKTYEIVSLENGKILQTVEADGFTTNDQGVVLFYEQENQYTTRINTATTQVSSSTVIVEKKAPKPALVVPIAEEECTKQ